MQALLTVSGTLTSEDAQQIFTRLFAIITPSRSEYLSILAKALQSIPGELAHEQTKQVRTQLVTTIRETTNPEP